MGPAACVVANIEVPPCQRETTFPHSEARRSRCASPTSRDRLPPPRTRRASVYCLPRPREGTRCEWLRRDCAADAAEMPASVGAGCRQVTAPQAWPGHATVTVRVGRDHHDDPSPSTPPMSRCSRPRAARQRRLRVALAGREKCGRDRRLKIRGESARAPPYGQSLVCESFGRLPGWPQDGSA